MYRCPLQLFTIVFVKTLVKTYNNYPQERSCFNQFEVHGHTSCLQSGRTEIELDLRLRDN